MRIALIVEGETELKALVNTILHLCGGEPIA